MRKSLFPVVGNHSSTIASGSIQTKRAILILFPQGEWTTLTVKKAPKGDYINVGQNKLLLAIQLYTRVYEIARAACQATIFEGVLQPLELQAVACAATPGPMLIHCDAFVPRHDRFRPGCIVNGNFVVHHLWNLTCPLSLRLQRKPSTQAISCPLLQAIAGPLLHCQLQCPWYLFYLYLLLYLF